MTELRLDGERVRRLCRERRVSYRHLGTALATNGNRIERLLQGRASVESVTLGDLRRLGETLGVEPTSLLLGAAPPSEPSSDDLVVEALLAHTRRSMSRAEVAEVLDWDLRRVRRAVKDLETRLAPSGQQLHRVGSASVTLRVRDELLTEEQRQRSAQSQLRRSGLTSAGAKALLRVATAQTPSRRPAPGTSGAGALVNLFNLGLVRENAARDAVLHPDVSYSLGLVDEPAQADEPARPTTSTERLINGVTTETQARRDCLVEELRSRTPGDMAVVELTTFLATPLATIYRDLQALRTQGLIRTTTRGRVAATSQAM